MLKYKLYDETKRRKSISSLRLMKPNCSNHAIGQDSQEVSSIRELNSEIAKEAHRDTTIHVASKSCGKEFLSCAAGDRPQKRKNHPFNYIYRLRHRLKKIHFDHLSLEERAEEFKNLKEDSDKYRGFIKETYFYNDEIKFGNYLKLQKRELKNIRCPWYELLNIKQLEKYHNIELQKLNRTIFRSEDYVNMSVDARIPVDNKLRDKYPEYYVRNNQLANFDGLTYQEKELYRTIEVTRIQDLYMLLYDTFNVDEKINVLILYKERDARKANRTPMATFLNPSMIVDEDIQVPIVRDSINVRQRINVMLSYPSTYNETNDGRAVDKEDRRHFEHNIHLARQVLWGNTGDSILSEVIDEIPSECVTAKDSNCSQETRNNYREKMIFLGKIITDQTVTLAEKQKMLEDYRQEIKPDEVLNTCGICGYRDYESRLPVTLVSLEQLLLLKMSPEQHASYMLIDPEYRTCVGVYERNPEDVYFVIPFFVNEDTQTGRVSVPQCSSCGKYLKKGKIPPFSMANENYGTPQRKYGMKCFQLSATSKNMCF